MRQLALLILLAGMASPAPGQDPPDLTRAAEAARRAWNSQNPAGLLGRASRVLLQLPGADPSAPVERPQAIAVLRDFFEGSSEVATSVKAAREVGQGRGFVELERRYRSGRSESVQVESVLLSYRLSGQDWILAEVRVSRR